jgi:hypothetical protein
LKQIGSRIADTRELLGNVLALAKPAFGFGPGRAEQPAEVFGKFFDPVFRRTLSASSLSHLASDENVSDGESTGIIAIL